MNNNKKTRFRILWGLVFSFCLAACSETDKKNEAITITWENEKAAAIFIPHQFVTAVPKDSIEKLLSVRLPKNNTSILGEYYVEDKGVEFRPLIAFSPGLKYEVWLSGKLINEIAIPASDDKNAPAVLAVYPSTDTLPENLLKFYIHFSKPMQQGEALDHIRLIKNNHDTVPAVFLDLQPELWNSDRTTLTLWLDPGRIKRDLQPNKTLGPPLQQGQHYQLLIDHNWQDANGLLLKNNFHKDFFTTGRDSISPNTATWTFDLPATGTAQKLGINFHESLDYVLATNTMQVVDANGAYVKGNFEVNSNGTVVDFIPAIAWKPSNYTLEAEARLEDLAGNNLNHLFDVDLTQKQHQPKDLYKKSFVIK